MFVWTAAIEIQFKAPFPHSFVEPAALFQALYHSGVGANWVTALVSPSHARQCQYWDTKCQLPCWQPLAHIRYFSFESLDVFLIPLSDVVRSQGAAFLVRWLP